MASQGPLIAATALSTTWNTPGNITADDGSNAVGSSSIHGGSSQLVGGDFGFSIPAGATIDGIEVSAKRSSDVDAGATGFTAVVILNGSAVGSGKNDTSNWNSTPDVITLGGPSDTWGRSWTAEEINRNDSAGGSYFGWMITNVLFDTTHEGRVDYMAIKVYYTLASPMFTDDEDLLQQIRTNW